jgi:hypothetical protein
MPCKPWAKSGAIADKPNPARFGWDLFALTVLLTVERAFVGYFAGSFVGRLIPESENQAFGDG